uniref:Uncharacterized protein n=1 Tax=Solanum tuberosum TaxID=4113 RepID=M1DRI2_SOLTU
MRPTHGPWSEPRTVGRVRGWPPKIFPGNPRPTAEPTDCTLKHGSWSRSVDRYPQLQLSKAKRHPTKTDRWLVHGPSVRGRRWLRQILTFYSPKFIRLRAKRRKESTKPSRTRNRFSSIPALKSKDFSIDFVTSFYPILHARYLHSADAYFALHLFMMSRVYAQGVASGRDITLHGISTSPRLFDRGQ